jgi:hypothetical protein
MATFDWTFVVAQNGDRGMNPGWYPVLVCWEPHEGFFPHGGQWTGSEWQACGPVNAYWPVSFENEQKAEEFAYEHDPNW